MERLSKKAKLDGEARKGAARYIPLQRWGFTKEIADATVWLFSDAGNYVSGSVVVVDGGSWRMGQGPGTDFVYPDFLLSGEGVSGVTGGRKSKL